jgi:hypothetical protein
MPEHTPGEPLPADDPEVLAFRALRGADEVANPETLSHLEVALKGLAAIAPTPADALKAADELIKQEQRQKAIVERGVLINVLLRSKSITPEQAELLREGNATQDLERRMSQLARALQIRKRRPRTGGR